MEECEYEEILVAVVPAGTSLMVSMVSSTAWAQTFTGRCARRRDATQAASSGWHTCHAHQRRQRRVARRCVERPGRLQLLGPCPGTYHREGRADRLQDLCTNKGIRVAHAAVHDPRTSTRRRSAAEETIAVAGEAPLIDTSNAVDRRRDRAPPARKRCRAPAVPRSCSP